MPFVTATVPPQVDLLACPFGSAVLYAEAHSALLDGDLHVCADHRILFDAGFSAGAAPLRI